jgi:Mg-chelatase subunit ChlD
VDRGVLRYRGRSTFAETMPPLEPAEPEPLPIPDNHEGIRGVAVRPDIGIYYTFAPATRAGDRAITRPARWFPDVIGGGVANNGLHDPHRLDAGAPDLVAVLDTSSELRLYRQAGGLYDRFHEFRSGVPATDVAVASGVAAILDGNLVRRTWLTCFANCPELAAFEPLLAEMRRSQDCRGELVPDDLWWPTAIAAASSTRLAVLDAGKANAVIWEAGQPTPLGVIRLSAASAPFRAFSDVTYDATGGLWVLARDGEAIRFDDRGRESARVPLTGLGQRGAESLAVAADGAVFVLASDESVVKFDPTGRRLADWSVSHLAGPGRYTDLTLTDEGSVLVPDGAGDRVLVFRLGVGTPPDQPPAGGQCAFEPRKVASPTRLELGDDTEITLTLPGSCPGAAAQLDIVLAIEASCDMSGDRLRFIREAGAQFASALGRADDRVAVVTFADEYDGELGGARLALPLTSDRAALTAALSSVDTACLPFLDSREVGVEEGLRVSYEALFGPLASATSGKVVILVAPGRSDRRLATFEAERLWRAGVRVYTVAVGQDRYCAGVKPDKGLLAAIASHPAHFRDAASPDGLAAIYAELATTLSTRTLIREVTVVDRLPTNMRLVPGSVSPPADVSPDGTLTWRFDALGAGGMPALRYRVEPLQPGLWPTNVEAVADVVDGQGQAQSLLFPVPHVEVIAPTPTATQTAEPTHTATPVPPSLTPEPTASPERTETATAVPTETAVLPTNTPIRPPTVTRPPPTAAPEGIFLPLLLKHGCTHVEPVDVAVVIDASSSMQGEKVAAARGAARNFIGQLDLPRDRASVITFNSAAHLLQPLTGDEAALLAALNTVATDVGTRIDLGLREGYAQLTGAGRREADPLLVLLTDGRPDAGTAADAQLVARLARQHGVSLYAIGLGPDVDAALLEDLAGGPDRVFLTPSERDLRRILEEVARRLPCR